MSSTLNLNNLKNTDEIKNLKVSPENFRGDFLVGYGWDDSGWQDKPHKNFLDQRWPNIPVVFTRVDGHASWVNSEALRRAGLTNTSLLPDPIGGKYLRDQSGELTGVLVDSAKYAVDHLVPSLSALQVRSFLLNSIKVFNQAGFTHIRDMECSPTQWQQACKLEDEGLFSLFAEENITIENLDDLSEAIRFAEDAQAQKRKHLRMQGIKFYIDGALGSNGALLSQNYPNSDQKGLQLFSAKEIQEILTQVWQSGFAVSVHTLGDEAVELLAESALQLKEKGIQGSLNLEHCQLVRANTILKLKQLKARCHMQPCHYLSDRTWLKFKLGELYSRAFPWFELEEAGVDISFGSDSPIEKPSLLANYQALIEAQSQNIKPVIKPLQHFHSHPDPTWGAHSYTEFSDHLSVNKLVFEGKKLG